jgi:hypothetical protein
MNLRNITVPYEPPQWNSKPAWKLPGWGEPVVSTVLASLEPELTIQQAGVEYFDWIDDTCQTTQFSHFRKKEKSIWSSGRRT